MTEVAPARVLKAGAWVRFASELIESPFPSDIFTNDGEAKFAKTLSRKPNSTTAGFNPAVECQAAGYGYDLRWQNERLLSVRIPPTTTGVRFTTPSAVVFSQTFHCSDAARLPVSGHFIKTSVECPTFTPIPSVLAADPESLLGENIKRIYDRFPQAWDAAWGDSGSPLLCRKNVGESWNVVGVLAGGSTERRIEMNGVTQVISIETYYTTTLGFKPGKVRAF